MLKSLYIKNFAIIDEISIDFEKGLNIISGETGSGKSILLNAINLIRGERFNKKFLGSFDNYVLVEAVFSNNENISKILKKNDFDTDEDIIITRKMSENSSVIKLNNRTINLSFLTQISDGLFDIHGQHSQLVVLNKNNYINIIDSFNPESENIKIKLKENLKKIINLKHELDSINYSDEEVLREADILKFQIEEIENFDFDNFIEQALNAEYKKLTKQTEIIQAMNKISYIINDSRSNSIKDLVSGVDRLLSEVVEYDEKINYLYENLIDIKERVYDFSREIDSYSYTLGVDEQRILEIEEIFSNFQNLKRKYGKNYAEILTFHKNAMERLEKIENIEQLKYDLNLKIKKIEQKNIELADILTNFRLNTILYLEKQIIEELKQMNMEYIQFKIQLFDLEKITENGKNSIDFLISTNKGQELKSLSTVSSGGEISRFMLALKATLAEVEEVQTLIFDEIDTGISGKTANIVGEKLKKISSIRQLIVITHLPQIATYGSSHYLISKYQTPSHTISNIKKLNNDERINEIARLIAGDDITENNKISAKELLDLNSKR